MQYYLWINTKIANKKCEKIQNTKLTEKSKIAIIIATTEQTVTLTRALIHVEGINALFCLADT